MIRTIALLIVLALLVGTISAPSVAQSPEPTYRLVRVYYGDRASLETLAARLDVWEVHPADKETPAPYLLAWVSTAEFQTLQAAGYKLDVLPDPRGGSDAPPCYPCYRTVAELYAGLNQIAVDHPGLTELIDIGDSWDKATPGGPAGHDLYVLKITNEAIAGPSPVPPAQYVRGTGKPRFFLMANIHGRELITPETAMVFIDYLTDNYGRDPDVTGVLNTREIHVLVSANPDNACRLGVCTCGTAIYRNTIAKKCSVCIKSYVVDRASW